MEQAFNPYLPSYEYVPDAEPHVFGDRVYIYGSHDKFNGRFFCMNDYVCWSAPIDDLKSWRYEGIIWRKKDDPRRAPLLNQMYAPDVVQGNDGRYYLYYFKSNVGLIGVASCDTPAGKYEFLGYVRYPDGKLLGRNKEKDLAQFDPGVFRDDDGKIYLYTGFGEKGPNIFTRFGPVNYHGALGVQLEDDMVTLKPETMARIAKTQHCSQGTGYEGHEFFEASSMRKFGDTYYFIYSSVKGHELCYATSDSPLGEFKYGGTLVSIGDVGIAPYPMNYLGNTHGSLIEIKGKYYVFYHRQTNRHCHSRQACAEEITRNPDGSFAQAEITSCGLNGGPLLGKGKYGAYIACHLYHKGEPKFLTMKIPKGHHPFFTQTGVDREDNPDQYVENFCNDCVIGFKYFLFEKEETTLSVLIAGKAEGKLLVKDGPDAKPLGEIPISSSGKEKRTFSAKLPLGSGKKALYLEFQGAGSFSFYEIGFAE